MAIYGVVMPSVGWLDGAYNQAQGGSDYVAAVIFDVGMALITPRRSSLSGKAASTGTTRLFSDSEGHHTWSEVSRRPARGRGNGAVFGGFGQTALRVAWFFSPGIGVDFVPGIVLG